MIMNTKICELIYAQIFVREIIGFKEINSNILKEQISNNFNN